MSTAVEPAGSTDHEVRRRIRVVDGDVEVVELGDGPVVGYLHGMVGNPVVHPFLRDLAASCRVVAPSLPGFDGSSPQAARSMHDWVFLASATIDATGLAGADVVAASVGAMVALELAAVRPEAFASLTLLAPLGLWDDADPVADVWSERTAKQPATLFADPEAFARLTADPPGCSVDEAMERELRRYRTRRSAASLMWPIPDHGLARRLGQVRCPVHVVWGSADRLASPRYAARFAAALPQCRGVTEIHGAGHLVEWDRPEQAAAAVRAAVGVPAPSPSP
jgi:pimeloyl-ACP methyl ester carboxylesterase